MKVCRVFSCFTPIIDALPKVAQGKYSESTLGVPVPEGFYGDIDTTLDGKLWKTLFQTKMFRISVVPDVEGVGLCGALKST